MAKSAPDFGARMAAWAAREPTVSGLVLIGSRERAATDRVWRPDAQSDWDFQIIASRPQMFADRDWLDAVAGGKVRAYAARTARIGGVPKVSAVLADTEADFVVIPTPALTQVRRILGQGAHRHDGAPAARCCRTWRSSSGPGGGSSRGSGPGAPSTAAWWPRSAIPASTMPPPSGWAKTFVCDYVWVRRRLARGEYRAAQRHLHRELAEANFRLLHELRLRPGRTLLPRGPPDRRRVARGRHPLQQA